MYICRPTTLHFTTVVNKTDIHIQANSQKHKDDTNFIFSLTTLPSDGALGLQLKPFQIQFHKIPTNLLGISIALCSLFDVMYE